MKILVLSDSHSALSFMRRCVDAVHPDAIVHLGDHFDDAEALKEEFPGIPFYQVPGNCDRYRVPYGTQEIRVERICGLWLRMHGYTCGFEVVWDDINLQDQVEEARAQLYREQARKLKLETDAFENQKKISGGKPAKRLATEEEEQENARNFCRKAEMKRNELCDDEEQARKLRLENDAAENG